MVKKRNIIFTLLIATMLIPTSLGIIKPTETKADTLKIGAAPMIFSGNNSKIEKGQTKEFEIKITNQSQFSKSQGQTGINNFTYKVHLQPTERDLNKYNNISNNDKKLVMSSKWVNIENNDFLLKPGEIQTVKFTVKVPEEANIGEYLTVLNIEEIPNNEDKSKLNVNISSALTVPLFIDVADPVTKSTGLKEGYKIEGFNVTDSLESTSMSKTIEGLIPFTHNWISNWNDFISKPYKFTFNLGGKEHIIYDIPKVNKSYLNELITNDKSKLSDKKYVYVNGNLNGSDTVERVDFNKNTIILYDSSNGKTYNVVTPSEDICQDIKNQMLKFTSTLDTKPTIDLLLGNVSLYSSKNATKDFLYLNYKIKNTGTETIVPKGNLLVKNDNTVIDNIQYSSTVIMPGETKDLIGQLDYSQDNFTAGNNNYDIQSAIMPYNAAKTIYKNNTIKLVHVRIFIYIFFALILLLIIFLIVFSIRRFIIKRKTKIEIIKSDINESN